MRIYLITRKGKTDYDETAGMVIAAPDENTARITASQATNDSWERDYDPETGTYVPSRVWEDPTRSDAQIIGQTSRDWNETKVIITDFRAG